MQDNNFNLTESVCGRISLSIVIDNATKMFNLVILLIADKKQVGVSIFGVVV